MFCISFALLLLNVCFAENTFQLYKSTNNILCRECGNQILTSDSIISKYSSASLYSFNDTIYGRKEVLVQVLSRDIFLRRPVIISSDSSCVGKGDWEDDDLWFPDYVMKPCFCSECGAFIGWIFENGSPTILNSADKFFSLILTNIIGENCNFFKFGLGIIGKNIVSMFDYKLPYDIPRQFEINMETELLSEEDKEFLAKCEEELKDRYTEKDEEYIKVYNRKPSTPPIVQNWETFKNFRHRNDRYNRRFNPYNRHGQRGRQGGSNMSYRGHNDRNNYNHSRY